MVPSMTVTGVVATPRRINSSMTAVLRHISSLKNNAIRGEELLDLAAEHSAGLIEDDNGCCHVKSLSIAANRPRSVRWP